MAILNLDELKRNELRHITQILMKEIASNSQDLKHFHRKILLTFECVKNFVADRSSRSRASIASIKFECFT
eukprot:UN08489